MLHEMEASHAEAHIILDRTQIEISCPGCGYKTAKTVGWLRKNTKLACPGCDHEIALEVDHVRTAFERADKRIEKPQRTLHGKFSRR